MSGGNILLSRSEGDIFSLFLIGTSEFYRYHLKDVIIGKIYFLLVRIKIKNMDLEIRRRESTGSGANTHVETETLAKFELMDGAPVRGMLQFLLPFFFGLKSKYDQPRHIRNCFYHYVNEKHKNPNLVYYDGLE